jgi:hypothetical protein
MTCPAPATRAGTLALAALAFCVPALLAGQGELVIVKEGTGGQLQYHRPGCPVVRDGKDVLAMTRGEAESRGYKGHRDCDPATAPATKDAAGATPSARQGDARPTPEEFVFVDAGGKYYHQQGCQKIGKETRKVQLKEVGKRWPCPTCRPPIRKRTDAPLVPGWRG